MLYFVELFFFFFQETLSSSSIVTELMLILFCSSHLPSFLIVSKQVVILDERGLNVGSEQLSSLIGDAGNTVWLTFSTHT